MIKHTALILSTMVISSVSFGYQKLSANSCAHRLYEEAGAANIQQAADMCEQRDDKSFVDCAVRLYNNIDGQEYSYATATAECQAIIPLPAEIRARNAALIRQNAIRNQSMSILSSLGFSAARSYELGSWMAETQSMSLAKCVQISFNKKRMHPDSHVESCYEQYQRNELTADGYNKVELEKERIAAEKRAAEEKRRQAELKRQAEERRRLEILRQEQLKAQQAEAARLRAENQRQLELQRAQQAEAQRIARLQQQQQAAQAQAQAKAKAQADAQARAQAQRQIQYPAVVVEKAVEVPRPKVDVIPKAKPEVKTDVKAKTPAKPATKPTVEAKKSSTPQVDKSEEARWWEEQRQKELRAQEEAAAKKARTAEQKQNNSEKSDDDKKKDEEKSKKPLPPPTVPDGKTGVIVDMPNPLG